MAFIRRSGIAPLLDALRRHCDAAEPLRVLTTTYTGSTERRALDQLVDLGAEVRVSYDLSTTRLHAKAWLFHRASGFSTAYIGSSNLTHSAQVTGLEWNVRASAARNPDVVDKFAAVFESYWQGGDFVPYDPDAVRRRAAPSRPQPTRARTSSSARSSCGREPFQERLLEQIALSRAARASPQPARRPRPAPARPSWRRSTTRACGRAAARPPALRRAPRGDPRPEPGHVPPRAARSRRSARCGSAAQRPQRFEHVFASIQSLNAAGLDDLAPDHFDVVIVDEFHHAAAPSYRGCSTTCSPVELLGLTATPERSDGLPILHWFDDRIAAELRLWDAIDQQRLSPFVYFGIHDGLDLRDIPWRRGRATTSTRSRTSTPATTPGRAWSCKRCTDHADDPATMRRLGLLRQRRARAIHGAHFNAARHRRRRGLGRQPAGRRAKAALRDLAAGAINVVFSVDLFNEGVDVPAGRHGAHAAPDREPHAVPPAARARPAHDRGQAFCTVLDFVGTHRREFRFDRRYRALLGGTPPRRRTSSAAGVPVPAGRLPHGARREAARDRAAQHARGDPDALAGEGRGAAVARTRRPRRRRSPTFLDESGLELDDVYDGAQELVRPARGRRGCRSAPAGPHEKPLRRALRPPAAHRRRRAYRHLPRFSSVTDRPTCPRLSERERRLLRMLVAAGRGPGR